MSKNILIDTTNNIETRIAVTEEGKLDDFEIEPSKKNAVKGDIYLAKIKNFQNQKMENDDKINEYMNKQNSNLKNNMLKSYDLYLNSRYDVNLNQKTIERVKNFFQ